MGTDFKICVCVLQVGHQRVSPVEVTLIPAMRRVVAATKAMDASAVHPDTIAAMLRYLGIASLGLSAVQ
jgi:hypothetical protein